MSNTCGSWQHLATCAITHKMGYLVQQYGNQLQITNHLDIQPPEQVDAEEQAKNFQNNHALKLSWKFLFICYWSYVYFKGWDPYHFGILAWDDNSFILDTSVIELIKKLFWLQSLHSTKMRGQQRQKWICGDNLCNQCNDFQIKQDKKKNETYIKTLPPIVCLWKMMLVLSIWYVKLYIHSDRV